MKRQDLNQIVEKLRDQRSPIMNHYLLAMYLETHMEDFIQYEDEESVIEELSVRVLTL